VFDLICQLVVWPSAQWRYGLVLPKDLL
jgi:hypothetical protein